MKPKYSGLNRDSNRFTVRGVSQATLSSITALVALSILGSQVSHAKTIIWDGGYANTGVWQNAGNWTDGVNLDVAFANGDDVVIGPVCKANYLGANRTVQSMTYQATCNAAFNTSFNNNGSVGGGVGNKLTFNSTHTGITIDAGNTFANALGNLANPVGAELIIQADLTVTHNGTGNYSIFAPITGAFGIEKTGSGTGLLILGNTNTYEGNTTITTGTLRLNSGNAIPDGIGKGNVVIAANGILSLNGQTETINGLTGTGKVENLAATDATLVVGANNTTSSFDGVIQNTGNPLNLTKTGGGNLTLSGVSTYSGATTIEGGAVLGVVGGSAVNSPVTLASSGSAYGVSVTDNTKKWTALSLTSAAASVLRFDFGSVSPSASLAPLAVTGAADFSAATPTVTVTGTNLPTTGLPKVIPLMTWGSTAGPAPSSVSLPAGYAGSLSVTGSTLNLTITSFTVALLKANNALALNNPSSWTTGAVPTSAQVAPWNNTVTAPNTTVLGTNTTWAGIKISDPNGLVTINAGNTLTLGAAATDIDLATATADLDLYCDLVVGAPNLWSVGAGRNVTLGGSVSGSAAITKNGSGSATLTGFNTFSGGLTLSSGILNLNSSSALGATASGLTITGGTLNNTSGAPVAISEANPMAWNADFSFAGGNDLDLGTGAVTPNASRAVTVLGGVLTVGGGIGGGGISLTKEGPGRLVLAGANSFTGEILVNAGILGLSGSNTCLSTTVNTSGTLNVNSATALGTGSLIMKSTSNLGNNSGGAVVVSTVTPQFWDGDFAFVGPNSLNTGTGSVTPSANRSISVNVGTLTVGGVIGGSFTIQKVGTGVLSLTAENTFPGTIMMSGGALRANTIKDAGVACSLGTGSVIQVGMVSTSGILEYNGTTPASTDRQVLVASPNSSGSGNATIQNNSATSTATLTFTNPAFNIANPGVATGGGKTLTLAGSNTGANEIQGAIIDNDGPANGRQIQIIKAGTGTWKLSGTNAYTNGTTVNNGVLMLGSGTAIPDGTGFGNVSVNGGGKIDMNGFSETVNGLSGTGTVDTVSGGTPTLTVGSNDQTSTFAGTIQNTSGSLALTKTGTGTLTLGGINTYTGATKVLAGLLTVTGESIVDTGKLVIDGGMVEVALDETVDTLYYGGAPQPAGTYGSTASTATTKDDTRFSNLGTGVLTVLTTGPAVGTPYDTWVALYQPGFTNNLPGQDQDGDGLTNRQEFAYGLNPKSASSVNPIAVGLATGSGNFSYTRYASSGLAYKVWSSTDLVTWTDRTGTATQTPGPAGVNGAQTVAVTNLGATPVNGKLFVRVTAE